MTSSQNHTAIILILLQFFKKIPLSAKFFSPKLQLSAKFFLSKLHLSAEFRLFYMWQKFREVYLPECGSPACNFQMNSRRICNLFFRAVQISTLSAHFHFCPKMSLSSATHSHQSTLLPSGQVKSHLSPITALLSVCSGSSKTL